MTAHIGDGLVATGRDIVNWRPSCLDHPPLERQDDSTGMFHGIRHSEKRKSPWIAEVRPKGWRGRDKIWLGSYKTAAAAARAVDAGYYFYNLQNRFNFPDSPSFLQTQIPGGLDDKGMEDFVRKEAHRLGGLAELELGCEFVDLQKLCNRVGSPNLQTSFARVTNAGGLLCNSEDMSFKSLPMLGHMTEVGAGDYQLNSKRVDTSEDVDALRASRSVYQLHEQQDPQEIDLLQECGSPPKTNDMTRLGASRAHADTSALHHAGNFPVSKHGGVIHEKCEHMQTFHGDAIHSRIPQEETTTRHKHQQMSGDSLQGSNQQRELLTYPEGEDNAVTITEKDMEGLQPMRFLSNNIVDFYIRYVERRLSHEIGHRFYFYNSYFFMKLLKSTACTNINHSKVDYEQLRKWTGGVNLFEKDYIFIPVVKSSHWSLIVICHLSNLTNSYDEKKGSPCMLHLDPIKGQHESFESQVRSYILEAWMDKFEISDNKDQFIALSLMKYIQCEVPQQDNNYDCGLYLLHYIEVFLEKPSSLDFKFASREKGVHFISPNFVEEVCTKRTYIQNLIHKLRGISQEQDAKRLTIQNLVEELWQTSQQRFTFQNFVEELSKRSQKLQAYLELEDEGYSKGRIKAVQNNSRTMSIVQGIESKDAVHLLLSENAIETQYQQCSTQIEATEHQTTWRLGLDNKPQDGDQVVDVEYQTRSETLLNKRQHENAPYMVFREDQKRSRRDTPWTKNEALEGSIEDVQGNSPIMFHTQGIKSKHGIQPSIGQNTNDDQHLIEDEVKNHQSSWELGSEDRQGENAKIVQQKTSQIEVGRYQQHQTIPCVMLSKHPKGKNKRHRNWTKEETSILLSCKVEGGRFCKESQGATQWKLISQEIEDKLGTLPSQDQCRLRYDTLLKSYKTYKKYCTESGKLFSEITEEERLELKLATTLSEKWYKTINEICERWPHKAESQKRAKLNSSVCNEVDLLSSYNSPPYNPPSSSNKYSFEDGFVGCRL